ncbi:MAG: class I SAM-dependent methyltransferase [Paludibacteraceae bacterium]|nr:class I SAM-dependent methyltransferase [Paludibacteraceae bacterium]
MASNSAFHRIWTYIRHVLSAWNTTGEGIHSPYLFYLVRFVLRDRNAFYCFADIERRRSLLATCQDVLDVVDYGSRGSKEGAHELRRVCDIANGQLESPRVGQILFRLVHFMGQQEKRPLEILELGTSLGITTAYLASVDSRNSVMTLEGSEAVLTLAQGVWRALKLENIAWQQGNIDNTLFKCARERLDIAYVDANHTYEATMRYVQYLLPRLTERGVVIIDDIHYSEEMERAWQELKQDKQVTTSMDLYHIGMLFVNPCYLKRHYRIRP